MKRFDWTVEYQGYFEYSEEELEEWGVTPDDYDHFIRVEVETLLAATDIDFLAETRVIQYEG